MLFIFTVNFFLPTYGGGSVEVVAPNPVAALSAAAASESGWMLLDANVSVSSITRGFLASCDHWNASALDFDGNKWECDDCAQTWTHDFCPEGSATRQGFRVYCERLAESGRF